MNISDFAVGQRWISTTELELGLGMIVEVEGRRVRVLFPASEEERQYAADNAPLTRLQYAPGDLVADAEGNEFTVINVWQESQLLRYEVKDTEGNTTQLPEQLLDSHALLRRPQERLFSGQIDRSSLFDLRAATMDYRHRLQSAAEAGLLGGRVDLLQHQLYIAHEVSSRHAPRVLLADEVGLGKTIEAGLILHRALYTGRASRALIVVPDSLVHQWLVEMLRRFNLRFTLLDGPRLEALAEEGNPFASAQLVLVAMSTLSGAAQHAKAALDAGWDMLIVDEAHHLGWSEDAVSEEYRCIEQLAADIPSVLLLTATPEQLGQSGHFARLRLLDPLRYHSLAAYRQDEAEYAKVYSTIEELLALKQGEPLPETLQRELADGELALWHQCGESAVFEELRERVLRRLLDRHGTGRVLFRNTRDTVSGFVARRLIPHPLRGEVEADSNSLDDLLQVERHYGDQWLGKDPRVAWLLDWLRQRDEKVLLICASATTARELEEFLRLRCGVRSAVFHEEMSLVNRDRAAAYFSDPEYGADILICSEIGSEGRNFQFAHQLVMFDLPLNPDLLEQRIGRLDRIGQTRDVEIHVPYLQDTPQALLLRWLHEGLDAFETPCACGASVFEEQRATLTRLLQKGGSDSDAAGRFVADTKVRVEQLNHLLDEGRNRLLELNSCNPERAASLVKAIVDVEKQMPLQPYLENLFDHFGIDYQHQLDGRVVVRPSEQMLTDNLAGLSEEGLSGSYQREMALHREDLEFLSWEHPLVDAAMEQVTESEMGNSAVATLKLPPLKPGTLLVEALFQLRLAAPRMLQLQRFLPAASWRVLLSSTGADFSAALPAHKLQPLLGVVPREVAVKLVRHARSEITALIVSAEQQAQAQQSSWIEQARSKVLTELNEEIARMKALAEVNANVRPEEIAHLQQLQGQAISALHHAQLQLDAVRVIVAS